MASFDSFGPKVRSIISESPIDIDVELLVKEFKRQRANERSDRLIRDLPDLPSTPDALDEALAAFIREAIQRKVSSFEPRERIPPEWRARRG